MSKSHARAFRKVARFYDNPALQKVVNGFLGNLAFDTLPLHRQNNRECKAIFLLLLFAGLCQAAPSWAAQTLSGMGSLASSSDSAFRSIEAISEGNITKYVNAQLQALPSQLPRVSRKRRPPHAYLVLDFHRDPSYSKKAPRGTTKGPSKNSTTRAWSYLVAELLVGGRKQVVGVVLRHAGERVVDHVARLFQYLPQKLHFRAVIFEGEFASADVLRFLKERNLFFLARCPARGYLKGLFRKTPNTPQAKAGRFWVAAAIQNKQHQEAFFDATWEWTPGGPRLLIKSPDWHLTIADAEELYGRRFNIESSFRDLHLFQPRTNSSNVSVQLMLVFVAFVWYTVYETAIDPKKPATTRKGVWEEKSARSECTCFSRCKQWRLNAYDKDEKWLNLGCVNTVREKISFLCFTGTFTP